MFQNTLVVSIMWFTSSIAPNTLSSGGWADFQAGLALYSSLLQPLCNDGDVMHDACSFARDVIRRGDVTARTSNILSTLIDKRSLLRELGHQLLRQSRAPRQDFFLLLWYPTDSVRISPITCHEILWLALSASHRQAKAQRSTGAQCPSIATTDTSKL
jgi:hypothetical protein